MHQQARWGAADTGGMLITIEDRCAWLLARLILADFRWIELDNRAIRLVEATPMASA